jgi:hypothetical protein
MAHTQQPWRHVFFGRGKHGSFNPTEPNELIGSPPVPCLHVAVETEIVHVPFLSSFYFIASKQAATVTCVSLIKAQRHLWSEVARSLTSCFLPYGRTARCITLHTYPFPRVSHSPRSTIHILSSEMEKKIPGGYSRAKRPGMAQWFIPCATCKRCLHDVRHKTVRSYFEMLVRTYTCNSSTAAY